MTKRNADDVHDSLGRHIRTRDVPRRIVSLVPSETESVVAIAGIERLVGRTDYCEEPPAVRAIPSVGGTKRFDVERVASLRPDLVLANQEENGERDVRVLIERGLPVHVSFPCDLEASARYLEALATLCGIDPDACEPVRAARAAAAAPPDVPRGRALVLIWREPWMSLDGRTYASAVLRALGWENACEARARRFPLAADLDPSAPAKDAGERDTRYPRLSSEEIAAIAPDLVLLPDEPYAFTEEHAHELRTLCPRARVELVGGKSLFWYGVRMAPSLGRLRAQLA